jgi:hypothetical protein
MSSSSKTSSFSDVSPEVAAEIARLMRDPDSMRAEAEQMRRTGGGGHYDPNQPRVPAGDPKGGQFSSKGYRGGDLGRDAGVTRASLQGTRFAQLGQGNPGDGTLRPFNGQLGDISAAQHEASRESFLRAETDYSTNDRGNLIELGAGGPRNGGRFIFIVPGGDPRVSGMRIVVFSTTYAHDRVTGTYATIRATPQRPIEIEEIDGEVFIGSYR